MNFFVLVQYLLRSKYQFHSHSIFNELAKLLIYIELATTARALGVIFAVTLSGTSIGAGFRPVRQKLTFRDLSTSIDSDDGCQRHRSASVLVQ
jgi:hypothetical protein